MDELVSFVWDRPRGLTDTSIAKQNMLMNDKYAKPNVFRQETELHVYRLHWNKEYNLKTVTSKWTAFTEVKIY